MSYWVVLVDAGLAYIGAVAVLLASETGLPPRRRTRRPAALRAWSRLIGVVAFAALAALVFALMFSDASPTLLVPTGVTFGTFAVALCCWAWFFLARHSRVALGAFAATSAAAAAVFATVWTASSMPATGVALASPCVLTVAALAFVRRRYARGDGAMR